MKALKCCHCTSDLITCNFLDLSFSLMRNVFIQHFIILMFCFLSLSSLLNRNISVTVLKRAFIKIVLKISMDTKQQEPLLQTEMALFLLGLLYKAAKHNTNASTKHYYLLDQEKTTMIVHRNRKPLKG